VKNWFFNMSVTLKLIILLLVITTTAVIAVAIIKANQVNAQTQSLLRERLQGNTNKTICTFDIVRIYTWGMLNTVTNMPQVHDALSDGSSVSLDENLRALWWGMNHVRDGIPLYANILLFDANMNIVAAANPAGDVPDLFLFATNISMAQMGQSFASYGIENHEIGLMQFLFTLPIVMEGRFLGMAAILGNTQKLDIFMRDFIHGYDSFVNVVDSSGTIFFSNRPAYIGRHVDDLGIYEVFGEIPIDTVFRHTSAVTGIDKIAYISIEPTMGWTVVSFFDAHAVESTARIIFTSLLPTVIGIVLAVFLVVLTISLTLRPLKNLAVTAKEVANGNLDVDFHINRNDEIGQVFKSFSEVVSSLKVLIEKAKSASKAKSDFLAQMSHEIRTPMNAVIGMAELILREDIPPSAREQAITIKNSGSHLLSIINDILDFSKIESGKLEVINTEYLLHSTINDVVNIINARMTNPNVQFVAYMEHDLPNRLIGDPVRLRQAMLNILNNAVKYTKEGRVTLDIAWKKLEDNILLLTIQVKDTGIGIRSDDLKKLFDEFQQFDVEKNINVEGTGLGLTITRSLVQLMGGEIKAESTYGVGSIFTITLPQKYRKSADDQSPEKAAGSSDGNTIILTGRTRIDTGSGTNHSEAGHFFAPDAKVLIVDDIETNLKVAEGLLKPYGMGISLCLSGKEALRAMQKEKFDLIFMDHMMPEMDGLETVSIIRKFADGKFSKLPIIALSANAIAGAREMFLQNGFDDFLPKPIEMDKLNSALAKWIPKEKQKQPGDAAAIKEKESALHIDGINIAKGLMRSGGSMDVYTDILKVFHKDGKVKLAQLEKCLKDNDLSLYTTYVHAIKSASGNIGADKISGHAAMLEEAGLKRNLDFITKNNNVLMRGLNKLLADIEKVIGANKPDNKGSNDDSYFDKKMLKQQLAELRAAMEKFDADAIDKAAETLGALTQHKIVGKTISVILQNVFVGQYEEAIARIDKVIAAKKT